MYQCLVPSNLLQHRMVGVEDVISVLQAGRSHRSVKYEIGLTIIELSPRAAARVLIETPSRFFIHA